MQRIELACHTGYSRMNGLGLGEDWVNFADANKIDTLVITDQGNVDAYIDFQKNIERINPDIKLIMGTDLYVINDRDANGMEVDIGRLSILIKNEVGKKNLYKILSEGERRYKGDKAEPLIPLSLLLENREGLLIGSGSSQNGLLICSINAFFFKEVCEQRTLHEFDKDMYDFLDYVEIPCETVSTNVSERLLELADYYEIPAVAVCSPHYTSKDKYTAYSILTDSECPDYKHYRSTEEMLVLFEMFGKEKACELVVTNTKLIGDMCEKVSAIPSKKMYPYIDNQDEILSKICEEALLKKYPEVTEGIKGRLKWELEAIKKSQSAFMFIQIKEIFDRLGLKPFEVHSRGTLGTSIVAYLCGISEVDPIRGKLCPYFFLGIDGDKEPDIDLNFSEEIQKRVHQVAGEISGVGTVIKPGTLCTISEVYAEKLIEKYLEKYGEYNSLADKDDIREELTKCIRNRGQHPGGLLMFPEGIETIDICPIRCMNLGYSTYVISAFEYHDIDEIIYKFDALGHNTPEIIKELADITGVDPRDISFDDSEVMEMFIARDGELPKCAGIAEFGSEYVIDALRIAKCQSFEDLVKLCGLMHGTDVWIDNAGKLIHEGVAGISEVIADRNDVYDKLIEHGIDEQTSFRIAEDVRKGKVKRGKSAKWKEWKAILSEHGLPEWFISSCEKISYLFPKAHSYSYMICSWRIAWYKLHYPLEYYMVMLNVSHWTGFDERFMAHGNEKMKSFSEFLKSDYSSKASYVVDAQKTLLLLSDYYEHGFEFKVSQEAFENGESFHIFDDNTIEIDGSKLHREFYDYCDEEC